MPWRRLPLPLGEADQVRANSLRLRLADMRSCTNSAHRRDSIRREVVDERLRGLHLQQRGIRSVLELARQRVPQLFPKSVPELALDLPASLAQSSSLLAPCPRRRWGCGRRPLPRL